jgi:hypothetical protein
MRSRYGAHPVHLLGHLALFAIVVYAALQLADARAAGNVLVWFVAAVLLHDAILWPLYSLLDGAGRRALGAGINFVRIPVGLSLLLLLVFSGTITGKGSANYERVSTLPYDGFFTRWLIATVVLFALSGALWVSRRRGRSAGPRPGR